MRYQNKVLSLFIYQLFWLNLFLEQANIIMPKCFQKNVNLLLKKKKVSEYITDDIENSSGDFDSEDSKEEIFRKENYNEENFVEPILYRIAEDHSDFKRFIRYPFNLHNPNDKVNF